MKTQAELGTVLSREQLKEIMGGKTGGGGPCLEDYTYDCTGNDSCCSKNCETNGTNTGTLCMP